MTMKIAVYTTIYPKALPFLPQFFESLLTQDVNFDLWVGLDDVAEIELAQYSVLLPKINFMQKMDQENYIQLRGRTLNQLSQDYDILILVDSDDVITGNRFARAINALEQYDVHVCSMQVVNSEEKEIGHFILGDLKEIIIYNFMGLSNVAIRSSVFKKFICFPPVNCLLLDWFYALQMLEFGVSIFLDPEVGMLYRQYDDNIAKVLPPFSEFSLLKMTELVISQFSTFIEIFGKNNFSIVPMLLNRLCDLNQFKQALNSKRCLFDYLLAINQHKKIYFWWEMIANKKLEYLWKK